MSWTKVLSAQATQYLPELKRILGSHRCCISYSPLPGNAKVTVNMLPDWETAAIAKDSMAGSRQVVRFNGVTRIRTTTKETIAMGDFVGVGPVGADKSDSWRFVLRDTGGVQQEVEFSFSECELDLSRRTSPGNE